MLCLGPAPDHVVPLFRVWAEDSSLPPSDQWSLPTNGISDTTAMDKRTFDVPHWIHVSFFDAYWYSDTESVEYDPRVILGAASHNASSVNASASSANLGIDEYHADSAVQRKNIVSMIFSMHCAMILADGTVSFR